MSQKPSAPASVLTERLHKPGWRDPKLLIGLLLILLSVLAVAGIIHATNRTKTFYIAAHDLSVGESISSEDLKPIDVRLGESEGKYFSAEQPLPENAQINQHFRSGELITANSLSIEDRQSRRRATVILDSTVASAFHEGDFVDVWISQKKDNGTAFSDPQVVMQAAEISRINAEESMIGSTGKSAIQILVTDDVLSDVLDATNNESKINLVPSTFKEN